METIKRQQYKSIECRGMEDIDHRYKQQEKNCWKSGNSSTILRSSSQKNMDQSITSRGFKEFLKYGTATNSKLNVLAKNE